MDVFAVTPFSWLIIVKPSARRSMLLKKSQTRNHHGRWPHQGSQAAAVHQRSPPQCSNPCDLHHRWSGGPHLLQHQGAAGDRQGWRCRRVRRTPERGCRGQDAGTSSCAYCYTVYIKWMLTF